MASRGKRLDKREWKRRKQARETGIGRDVDGVGAAVATVPIEIGNRFIVHEGDEIPDEYKVWHTRLKAMIDRTWSDYADALTSNEFKVVVDAAMAADEEPGWLESHSWQIKTAQAARVELDRMRILAGQNRIGERGMKAVREIVAAVLGYRYEAIRAAKRAALPEGQAAVANYRRCLEALLSASYGDIRDLDDDGIEVGTALAKILWASMREARVFEFPVDTYRNLFNEALRSVAQWHQQKSDEIFADDVGVMDRVRMLAKALPFPDKLPFDRLFVGIGCGYTLDGEMATVRLRSRNTNMDEVMGATVLGYLIDGPSKLVYEMVHVVLMSDDYIMPIQLWHNDETWTAGETLAPWLVMGLVLAINEHNTVVTNHPTLEMKLDGRSANKGKRIGYIPRPYYTLRMRHQIIEDDERKDGGGDSGRTISYRYDRRGHERCYVERGEGPIDPKLERKLLKYGYRFLPTVPDAEDHTRLAYRGLPPKRTNEWMAIKVRWIEDAVCGAENLPYVPAVRVPE